ncbi:MULTISPECIES: 30S ribosome-binding factor RbfA [Hallerella]|uniref:Ribosome-binding factor A n=1 Tax=Hallerella succinigenes TaxID=1896222 RepID=A0A2M9A811_9BACT|nr:MULTISPECIES: 30S ribosome-binding factor RbfA [Hallerella]MBS7392426.1 30S ribosome-binding factor RbfA [Fibrobacter sp.]MCI6873311.1 30S ribosome-binding factor RbfA [Hallerella sp.]MDD6092099.1 30S ribosome-binding factor RbfA [Hallerella succinigenes]MDY5029410.1 30S ribosome-binding factor RbfA [Hallerella succinigenes]PJJ41855.1 ribosome-binding factor A [Hallerella succinigenes]
MPRNSHSHSNRRVPRTVRLDEQFREEISKLLMKGLKDPRIGFVTISRVEITNDLSYAKVFISVLGSDREKAASLIGLRNSAGFIRTYLGKALKIRKIPQLSFLLDESLDHAMHIEEILAELKEQGEL